MVGCREIQSRKTRCSETLKGLPQSDSESRVHPRDSDQWHLVPRIKYEGGGGPKTQQGRWKPLTGGGGRAGRTLGAPSEPGGMRSAAAQQRAGDGALGEEPPTAGVGGGRRDAPPSLLLLSFSLHQYHPVAHQKQLAKESGKCSFQDRKWSRPLASRPLLQLLQVGLCF